MSFLKHQAFIEKYDKMKVHGPKRKFLLTYLATLSDSEKKYLLSQIRLRPRTVEKLLAIK
jgi:hypothetical protein